MIQKIKKKGFYFFFFSFFFSSTISASTTLSPSAFSSLPCSGDVDFSFAICWYIFVPISCETFCSSSYLAFIFSDSFSFNASLSSLMHFSTFSLVSLSILLPYSLTIFSVEYTKVSALFLISAVSFLFLSSDAYCSASQKLNKDEVERMKKEAEQYASE